MMNITIPNLYDSDYQLWLENTINQLRQGDFQSVDWPNLLEELADLGKSERRALESLLTRLLEHLLKLTYWQSQRDYNQAGWKKEIRNFRIQIKKILKDSPSLKSYLREILQECYLDARNLLIDETQLDASIFPLEVLANLEEIAWKGEIRTFRKQIKKLLRDSPSLKPYLSEILEECYSDAREIIIDITQLDASIFPLEVSASLEEILAENWLPNWEAISNNSEKCN